MASHIMCIGCSVHLLCRPEFAVLGAGGLLQRWDLSTHRCLASRQFAEGALGSCLASARDASFLAVGCSSGHLYVVDGDSLEDMSAHRNTGNAIERCVHDRRWSGHSRYVVDC